jgi:ABC-2 type transport system ATP-binding protein
LPVVRIRSAVCLLDRFPALAGADLDVDEGEIVLLSGPNGAGKSTMLRLLAGLLPLRSGAATVLGHDLTHDRKAVRRDIALVGHQTFCYDDLSVAENARFAARAARRPIAAADEALARLELTRVAGVVHRRLSAGQQRRLAVAIALARDPRLLLLDEPHAGLDAGGRELLDGVIAGAPAEGRTVVIASHELGRARAISTREVHVVAGRVLPATAPLHAVPAPGDAQAAVS